ncbi:MAG: lipolytic protein family [Fibrobacteres bacterium]|nr:lipolytic protein family [Fibrobacterota bacterium]
MLAAFAHAEKVVVIIGSSTAAGTGASTYDSAFAGRYAHYLPTLNPAWKLVNLAVGGYTTFQLMPTGSKTPANRPAPDTAHNVSKALSLHPDVMLLALASNDIAAGYATNEYQDNYDTLKARAEAAGIKVWISSPVPRSALDSASRQRLLALRTRVLSRYAPRAIDFYDSLGTPDGSYYPGFNSGDGIHTNNRGHKILFDRVVAANMTAAPVVSVIAERGKLSLRLETLGRKGGAMVVQDGLGAGLWRDLNGRFAAGTYGP